MIKTTNFGYLFLVPVFFAGNICAAVNSFTGSVGTKSNQVNQNVGNVPGNRFSADLNFDYINADSGLSTGLGSVDGRFTFAGLINDQSLTMYSLKEAYIGLRPTRKIEIKAGRQVLNWSELDSAWGFGKLNNRRNFDYFEPGQEGLIGLNTIVKISRDVRLMVFASYLYVPEMNPALDINKSKKTITSRHPWADAPATSAEISPGLSKKIMYEVDYPQIQDVIYRTSLGFNFGMENKHWVFDNFFIRKPENQMSQKVNVAYSNADDAIKAYIKPQFYFHDVYGSTLKYRNADLEMYASAIASQPNTLPDGNREATRQTEIKTEKMREDYMGGGIAKTNDVYGVGFNYVARLSPYDRKKENLTLDPRWNQAINFNVYRFIGRKLKLSSDFKYDMLTTDRLFMVNASYFATKFLLVYVGVNMIGTPSDGKSYWSPYTNNDSMYGGLRYIF